MRRRMGYNLVLTCLHLQVGYQIKTRVQELGHGCIYLVQKAGALQLSPTDSFCKRELIECARAVMEKVSRTSSARRPFSEGIASLYQERCCLWTPSPGQ